MNLMPITDKRTVGQIIFDQAKKYQNKPFLIFEDEVITYNNIYERSKCVAGNLWDAGIRKGDKIGVICTNRPEFLDAIYGILTIGAIEVPINTGSKGDLLSYVINQSDIKAIIIEAEFLSRLVELKELIPNMETIWIIGDYEHNPLLPWTLKSFDSKSVFKIIPEIEISPSDLSGIVYTSGTTGPSKGVMCTHHYFYNFAAGWSNAVRLTPDDIYYTPLPFFHFAAQVGTAYSSFITGATVVMGKKFSSNEFWNIAKRYKVTGVTLLGSLCQLLYKEQPKQSDRDHNVRFFWTAPAPAPEAVYTDFENRFNIKLLEGYGMTETNIPLYMPYDEPKAGSCGKTWDAFDVEIVDENDWPVPCGAVGEIVTRPKLPWVMMTGYYKMPEKTFDSFRNLWFHTGDKGKKDEDGYFYYVDRVKDCIRRYGENISSYEIEKVINSHPGVVESAAIGIPTPLSEEEVLLKIVLKEGVKIMEKEILYFCVKKMSHFMVPQYIEFVDFLPKTPNGKVQKKILREAGLSINSWSRKEAGIKIQDLI